MSEELNVIEMEETVEVDVNEIETENEEYTEVSGGEIIAFVGVVGSLISLGVTVWKNRSKIGDYFTEQQIRRLEKKGYSIVKIVDDEPKDSLDEVETEN